MRGQSLGERLLLRLGMAHEIGRIDAGTREAMQVLGGVLRQLRTERGLSQRRLARRCGLSQSTISRLECGLAEGVRVAWVARLLAGLDTSVRLLPDNRPLLERSHAFKRLRQGFSPAAGDARRRARDQLRRDRLEALMRRAEGRG
jgi:transcriptional regulator with XRE-family HTH domain